ncbi:MAG: hypothetical protein WD115_02275 [Balneolaceae bacterium]
MIYRLLSITVWALFPALLMAQGEERQNHTGSAYSHVAFGEPLDLYAAGASGTGLRGVSSFDNYVVNSANPALWGVGAYSRGALSLDMQHLNATQGVNQSARNRYMIERFQLILPIQRNRLGLSVGFMPVTRSNFSLENEGSMTSDQLDVEFLNQVEGTGGVNRAEAGLGYRINSNIAVGYAMNYYFASLNRYHRFDFDNAAFGSMTYDEQLTGTGLGHRFGLFLRRGDLLNEGDDWAAGFNIFLPTELDMSRDVESYRLVRNQNQRVDLLGDSSVRNGTIELPLEFNMGLTYTPSRYFVLHAEWLEQKFGSARYTFQASQEQMLRNRRRMGGGFEFHPYRNDEAGGFFSRFKYSAGASKDTGYLNVGGDTVDTVTLHAGLGILSGRTASSVDIGFYMGFRGAENSQQVDERIWGLKVTLNLAEIMFVPPMFQ